MRKKMDVSVIVYNEEGESKINSFKYPSKKAKEYLDELADNGGEFVSIIAKRKANKEIKGQM